MQCDFEQCPEVVDGVASLRCKTCGKRTRIAAAALEHGMPRSNCGVAGLGDFVESNLSALGITKSRWRKLKATLGFRSDCNCTERQEWLNDFGREFGAAPLAALRRLIGR